VHPARSPSHPPSPLAPPPVTLGIRSTLPSPISAVPLIRVPSLVYYPFSRAHTSGLHVSCPYERDGDVSGIYRLPSPVNERNLHSRITSRLIARGEKVAPTRRKLRGSDSCLHSLHSMATAGVLTFIRAVTADGKKNFIFLHATAIGGSHNARALTLYIFLVSLCRAGRREKSHSLPLALTRSSKKGESLQVESLCSKNRHQIREIRAGRREPLRTFGQKEGNPARNLQASSLFRRA